MNGFKRFILVAAVSVCLVATAQAQWPLGKELSVQEGKSTEGSPYVTTNGRYQIFVSPQAKGHTFMLDTDTGRVWIMKKDSTSGDFSLQRVPVEQVDTQATEKSETKQTKNGDKPSTSKK
ncbi:MAG: hypothetical protein ACLP5H_16130 [Desulfomonilaceae bacterium]